LLQKSPAHLGVEVQLDLGLYRLNPEVTVATWHKKVAVDADAASVVVHVFVVNGTNRGTVCVVIWTNFHN